MKKASALLVLIIFLGTEICATFSGLTVSLPGCPSKCDDVSIPYPFGIGAGCAATNLSPYFTVTCNNTFQPPRPTVALGDTSRELIDISLERGEMRIYGKVSYTCFTSNTTMPENYTSGFSMEGTPFVPSTTRNRFTAIGCNTMGLIGGYMHSNPNLYVAGCYSYCQSINSTSDGAPCTGMGCCEAAITPNLRLCSNLEYQHKMVPPSTRLGIEKARSKNWLVFSIHSLDGTCVRDQPTYIHSRSAINAMSSVWLESARIEIWCRWLLCSRCIVYLFSSTPSPVLQRRRHRFLSFMLCALLNLCHRSPSNVSATRCTP